MHIKLDLEQPFTWDEHRERIARVRSAMADKGIEVLLVTSLHSLFYLFGVDKVAGGGGLFQGVVLPLTGEPVTIVFRRTRTLFEQSPVLGEVQTWVELGDAIKRVMDAIGRTPGKRKIGFETGFSALSPRIYMAISQPLIECGVQIVDASDLILAIRARKSATEIAYMKRAAEILDVSFLAGIDAMRPGSRECDIAGASVGAAYAAGGEHSIFPPLIAAGVNSFLFTHTAPSRRPFKNGEVIAYEAGASYHNYHVVGAQSVIFGADPTADQKEAYKISREKVAAGCNVAGPGVSGADVAQAILAVGPSEDLLEPSGACLGYTTGIGFDAMWFENFITPDNKDNILEPGMVLSVFGSFACGNQNWTLCVDPILITETGIEHLTHIDRDELKVVGV